MAYGYKNPSGGGNGPRAKNATFADEDLGKGFSKQGAPEKNFMEAQQGMATAETPAEMEHLTFEDKQV